VKAQEYRNQTVQELQAELVDAKKALFNLVNTVNMTKKAEKPHEIGAKKQDIARILTVLREKQASNKRDQ
jgi:large subunit ribosomal protein L29